MFGGFSSGEEDEGSRPPPPVPPASLPPVQTLSLAPNIVLPADSQIPNSSVVILPILPSAILPLQCDQAIPETFPPDSTKGKGGFRAGAGRSRASLPLGCVVFLTDSGAENFICGCEKSFADKRSLLRHYQSCATNQDQPPLQQPCKKRKLDINVESEAEVDVEHEHDTQVHGDTITTACFNEDAEGAKLLQCKLNL